MHATRASVRTGLLAVLLLLAAGCGQAPDLTQVRARRAGLEASLAAAGPNRAELERALAGVEADQREGMRFLIEEMPLEDLRDLSSAYLIENVRLAYAAWDRAAWKADVPHDVFLNEVLPYATASEPRNRWRKTLFDDLMPVVADCDTTTEAVYAVNDFVWNHFGIEYSMERERPDQAPSRTIEIGLGSCTSVAIFLNASCRAVAVPARVVGISEWPHMAGNHSWVEFWDEGGWHFTGAMESDEPVDDTWFVKPTSLATKSDPNHAIYAASFRWTGDRFAMHWAQAIPVHGVNVTDRYVPGLGAEERSR